jgi:hypothetical protein
MATIVQVTVRSTIRPTEVSIKEVTETRGFTDTIIIIRGNPITASGISTNQTVTAMDITTDQTIAAMAATPILGCSFLHLEPESILDSASDAL